MQKLRRSLQKDNGSAHRKSPPTRPAKAPVAIEAPKAVIKALYDYQRQADVELSFQTGDFFHVVGGGAHGLEDPNWFDACNPATGQRGLVPVQYFQVLGRQARDSNAGSVSATRISATGPPPQQRTSAMTTATARANPAGRRTSSLRDSGYGEEGVDGLTRGMQAQHLSGASAGANVSARPAVQSQAQQVMQGRSSQQQERGHTRQASSKSKASPLYGVVQYDFVAERPDELNATAGEAIIIIAQSNHEWFVAKPIGRLGGPGLIPVAFVEIRDLVTGKSISDQDELAAKAAAVPKVEEWKKQAAEYKSASIPLGRFNFDVKPTMDTVSQAPPQTASTADARRSDYSSSSNPDEFSRRKSTPELLVARASVDQFLISDDRYWFLVRVEMSDGRHRNLCRFYEDFYDFQIALLDAFPDEAGRTGDQRSLPFMPGPLTYVDDTISAQRRADLHIYVEELCRLPLQIVRSPLVQQLFAAREGDVESVNPTSMMPQPLLRASPAAMAARSASPQQQQQQPQQQQQQQQQQGGYVVQPALARMGHERQESQTFPRGHHRGPSATLSRASATSTSSRGGPPPASLSQVQAQQMGGHQPLPSVSTAYSRRLSSSGKSTTASMLKIKLHFEDDLIAIRVPNDISFERLCEKLKERLSGDWSRIRWKDEAAGTWVEIAGEAVFQSMLDRTDKVVLFVT